MKNLKKDMELMLAKKADATFSERVWQAAKRIPKGKVTTYGHMAKMIGRPGSGRAVGNALNKNPFAPIVPCHRIVRSDGDIGGFASGPAKKIKLLMSEGVTVSKNHVTPLAKFLYLGK